jgi:hypothetical protein
MNRITLFACLIFLSGSVFSQTTIKPAIGLNFTDWSKNVSTGDFQAKAGYQIGGSVAFGKKIYIEPGLFYVGKSTQFTSSDTETSQDFKQDLQGFRVPVAVGFNLLGSESTLVGLRGFGGLSAFVLTGTKGEINKDDLKNASFGAFAGAGVDIWKLFVDLSYEWSLTNIQKDVSSIDVGKTRTLFINAGIRINL